MFTEGFNVYINEVNCSSKNIPNWSTLIELLIKNFFLCELQSLESKPVDIGTFLPESRDFKLGAHY